MLQTSTIIIAVSSTISFLLIAAWFYMESLAGAGIKTDNSKFFNGGTAFGGAILNILFIIFIRGEYGAGNDSSFAGIILGFIAAAILTGVVIFTTEKKVKHIRQAKQLSDDINTIDQKIEEVTKNLENLETILATSHSETGIEDVRKSIMYHNEVLSRYHELRNRLLTKKYEIDTKIAISSIDIPDFDKKEELKNIDKKINYADGLRDVETPEDRVMKKYM